MSEILNPMILLFEYKPESIGLYNLIEQIEKFYSSNELDSEVFMQLIDIKANIDDNEDVEENLKKLRELISDFFNKLQDGITAAQIRHKQRTLTVKMDDAGVGDGELYSVTQAAKKLNISRQAIDQKIRNGQLPAIKVSIRKRAITQKVLNDYLKIYNK